MKKLIALLVMAVTASQAITVTIDNVVAAHQTADQADAYTGRLGELVYNMGDDPSTFSTNIHNGFVSFYNGIDEGGRAINPGANPTMVIYVDAIASNNDATRKLQNGTNLVNAVKYADLMSGNIINQTTERVLVIIPPGNYVIYEPLALTNNSGLVTLQGTVEGLQHARKYGNFGSGDTTFFTYDKTGQPLGTFIALDTNYTGSYNDHALLTLGNRNVRLFNIFFYDEIQPIASGSGGGGFAAKGCSFFKPVYTNDIPASQNIEVAIQDCSFNNAAFFDTSKVSARNCSFFGVNDEFAFKRTASLSVFQDCYFKIPNGIDVSSPSHNINFYNCHWDTVCTQWFQNAPGFGGTGFAFYNCILPGGDGSAWFEERIAASFAINDGIKFYYCLELPDEIADEAGFLIRYCVDESDAVIDSF